MVWSGAVKAGAGQVAGKHVEFRTEAMVPVPIAGGYLLKERDTRRLVDAIREVADGGAVFDPEVTQRLAGNRSNRTPVAPLNPLGSLTAQELRLLAEVARGKTDKEVAVVIGLTHKTARNYLDRIFTKLGVHTRTEAAMLYARNRPDAGPR